LLAAGSRLVESSRNAQATLKQQQIDRLDHLTLVKQCQKCVPVGRMPFCMSKMGQSVALSVQNPESG
jgi:hypothetical protein